MTNKQRILQLYQSGYTVEDIKQVTELPTGKIIHVLKNNGITIQEPKKRRLNKKPIILERDEQIYQALVSSKPKTCKFLPVGQAVWDVQAVKVLMEENQKPVKSPAQVMRFLKKFDLVMENPWKNALFLQKVDACTKAENVIFLSITKLHCKTDTTVSNRYLVYSYKKDSSYAFLVYRENTFKDMGCSVTAGMLYDFYKQAMHKKTEIVCNEKDIYNKFSEWNDIENHIVLPKFYFIDGGKSNG